MVFFPQYGIMSTTTIHPEFNEVKIENLNFQSRDLCLRAVYHKLVHAQKAAQKWGKL